MTDDTTHRGLTQLLETLEQRAQSGPLSLGELVELFRERGFGALLFIFAFIIFLPTGLIPGLAALCALMITLISAQMLTGRRKLWLPETLRRKRLSGRMLLKGSRKMKRPLCWLDRHTRPRAVWVMQPISCWLVALICFFLGLVTMPLSFIPGVGSITSAPILLLSLGLMVTDGLLLGLGLAATLLSLAGALYWGL